MTSLFYALKVGNGAYIWSYATGDPILGSPAIANGSVYIGSNDGYLYSLNARTGALQWSSYFGYEFDLAGPSVANGVVYAAAGDGTLYALDEYSNILWSAATVAGGFTNPSISDGVVYYSSFAAVSTH